MVAGATRLDDEASAAGMAPQWLGSIGSGDVDATVALAVSLGARVLQPAADMPNVGRIALLADPQGALFGVYKPERDPGEAAADGFNWHELAARELESAFDFYRALFGWQVLQRMDMGAMGTYLVYGRGGKQEGGMYVIPAGRPQSPAWLPYAHHKSADEAARAAVAAGGKVANGPMDVPGGGRIAQLLDPHGVMFAVHSMAAPASAASPAKAPAKSAAKAVPAKRKGAVKATRKPAAKKSGAKKSTRKPVRKVAAKATRKPARKVARKKVRKVARKTARPARKAPRRAARKK